MVCSVISVRILVVRYRISVKIDNVWLIFFHSRHEALVSILQVGGCYLLLAMRALDYMQIQQVLPLNQEPLFHKKVGSYLRGYCSLGESKMVYKIMTKNPVNFIFGAHILKGVITL